MVKKIGWFFLYCSVFLLALGVFIPKSSLYFAAEKELKKFQVVISDETLEEKLLSLEVRDAKVYLKGVELAVVKQTHITLFGLYNKIELHDMTLAKVAQSMVPQKISHLQVGYSVVSPLSVKLGAQGEFGVVVGELSLQTNKMTLKLKPSKMMLTKYKKILSQMKKEQNGEYSYVQSF